MTARRSRRPGEGADGTGDGQLSRHGIRRGDRQLMVDMNRNLVLNVLRTGAASRADVVRTTGLSPTTVSAIVSELVESGLINEVGEGKSSGGRPPLLLRIDDERNYIVGLKVTRFDISIAVTDLRAEVLHSELVELDGLGAAELGEHPFGSSHANEVDPASVLDQLCAATADAVRKAGVGLDQVVGIGIGLAGLVEAGTGICRYSPAFGWRNVAVAGPLAQRLGRPVLVDNDVNTLTVAEQWFGRGHGVDDFVVVTVGEGVGAGLVIDGKLCRGVRGAAGEIGHLPVGGSTVRCRCGQRGCLEALSSDHAVLRYIDEALQRGESSSVCRPDTFSLTIHEVREAAESGDSVAARALEKAGYALGVGIATLVNLLNPRLVILSGEGTLAGPLRSDAALAAMQERTFADLDRDVEFVVDSADDVSWARGAACIVLGELFSAPIRRSVDLAPIARRERAIEEKA
ncbi:MAG TPA: ROK family transcriptional regulator [Acidimicrobiales bacterium]|nr:ROK family transcriptional regulator [Acidimicrobiales bacterium]